MGYLKEGEGISDHKQKGWRQSKNLVILFKIVRGG